MGMLGLVIMVILVLFVVVATCCWLTGIIMQSGVWPSPRRGDSRVERLERVGWPPTIPPAGESLCGLFGRHNLVQ